MMPSETCCNFWLATKQSGKKRTGKAVLGCPHAASRPGGSRRVLAGSEGQRHAVLPTAVQSDGNLSASVVFGWKKKRGTGFGRCW